MDDLPRDIRVPDGKPSRCLLQGGFYELQAVHVREQKIEEPSSRQGRLAKSMKPTRREIRAYHTFVVVVQANTSKGGGIEYGAAKQASTIRTAPVGENVG